MLKAILLLLALLLVYWFFWGARARKEEADTKTRPAAGEIEKMVVCAYCHLRVPESEAIADAGHFFCCEEHRRLDAS